MESTYLKQLVNATPTGGGDVNAPYSYLEWKERTNLISEKDLHGHYNIYVIQWFKKNKQKTVSQKFVLRQKYLYLLDQLQLFFSEEEKNTWYSQVNLADERELLQAIPYFAKKLKDVALYYLKLRKRLKNVKLKYNAVGTTTGVEREIYSYLLETFSSENNELSPFLQTTVPKFSALQNNLVVQIEELYDDKQYFDLSPTQSISKYYDLFHEPTASFLSTKGIVLSSSESLLRSFNVPVSTTFDSFIAQLTGNIFELSDAIQYNDFIQKYVSENKPVIAFNPALTSSVVTEIPIGVGNNYFYYPYGTTDTSIIPDLKIISVALSSISIGSAIAGSTLENSDKMFVRNGSVIKGAWLRYKEFDETQKTVKATLKKDSATSFIYPFPGYGLSSQNVPWTGAAFESTPEYDFLDKHNKVQVNNAYWSQALPTGNAINNMLLNDTNLISNGATPSTNPEHADQFYTRLDRTSDTTIPFGELSGAWLYKFTKTSIPIDFTEDNVVLWPYTVLNTDIEYPAHYKTIPFKSVCTPTALSELTNSYFIPASSISVADKVYKLNRYDDLVIDATECAWLSSSIVNTGRLSYFQQDGLTISLSAGNAIRFIWMGPNTPLDSVFKTLSHKNDCPLSTNTSLASALEWQSCSCKQVHYTPFGHPGTVFEENNSFADYIIKDVSDVIQPHDLASWRDSDDNPALNSIEFAWYKTNTSRGWGNGQWVSNFYKAPTPFTLKTGEAYFYRRAQARDNIDGMPNYSVNYKFGTTHAKWIEATLSPEGDWVSTGKESSMVINPGDFLKFDRNQSTVAYKLSSYPTEGGSYNLGSVWAIYDKIPYVCGKGYSTLISWPAQPAPIGFNPEQYPIIPFSQITSIYGWTITRDADGESQTIIGEPTVTFVPPCAGTYSISVTANVTPVLSSVTYTFETSAEGLSFAVDNDYDKQNVSFSVIGSDVIFTFNPKNVVDNFERVVYDTMIPKITAYDPPMDVQGLPFSIPSSGFLLEHPLKGWNYNTYKFDAYADGARPYWAVLYLNSNTTTRYKGIYSWGYPDQYINDYLPNNTPEISPIELKFGTILEYFRKGYSFVWNQPITYKQFVGSSQWCEISSDSNGTSSLSSIYSIKQHSEPFVLATNNPTSIVLSNILNGSPVEVFYYALDSFTWLASVLAIQDATVLNPGAYYETETPWAQLGNRYYPTIASIPVVEEVYSAEDVGGYFLPQNLGASVFLNKDFTVTVSAANLSGIYLIEDITTHVGGRGRTKEDQPTIFNWSENNIWLKESSTAGDLAGAPKKQLTKTLQTFIPYQSNTEEVALGLVTPSSRLSPWGGANDEEWTDVNNNPQGFTGVKNPLAWASSQIIKYNEKEVDCWTSDIYGNQYGLFKELTNIPAADHANVPGELWMRTNSQKVGPGHALLSSVFLPFNTINQTVYKQLTGNGILSIENYFNTMFIETSSAVIFANIDYNFETEEIDSSFDSTKWKLLSATPRFDQNWFLSPEKKIISLFTKISGSNFYPVLYELDISVAQFRRIFPQDPQTTLTELSGITIKSLSRGSINYNRSSNVFLITYTGTDLEDKMFISDFYIKYDDYPVITKVDLYRDLVDDTAINEPPEVLSPYLSAINVGLTEFTVSVSATNSPKSYSLINYTPEISASVVDGYGVFTGMLPKGLHHINYTVSNNVGDSIYCLTLSAI